jgi:hypothetical protein
MAPTGSTVPADNDSDDYPENWIFDEHGQTIAGTFLRFERGQTKNYGPKPIAVLEVDGAERSLWLNTAVLAGKFRDELQERPQRELSPGERIVVKRLGKTATEDGQTEYWNYRVLFPDKPTLKTSDLFDFEGEPPEAPRQEPKAEEPPLAAEQDDDGSTPF